MVNTKAHYSDKAIPGCVHATCIKSIKQYDPNTIWRPVENRSWKLWSWNSVQLVMKIDGVFRLKGWKVLGVLAIHAKTTFCGPNRWELLFLPHRITDINSSNCFDFPSWIRLEGKMLPLWMLSCSDGTCTQTCQIIYWSFSKDGQKQILMDDGIMNRAASRE